jgi:hypothetical protein
VAEAPDSYEGTTGHHRREPDADARFDQIVNTAFAIKSHRSSLIQVADAVAYIRRRHLELMNGHERWAGEKDYFAELVGRLPKPARLGRNSGGPRIDFYEAARHKGSKL